MKQILLIILLISSAFTLSAGPALQGFSAEVHASLPGARATCAGVECGDTIRIADTVWRSAPVRHQSPAPAPVVEERSNQIPDILLEDTFNRGIGKATTLFVPKGTLSFGLTASYNSYDLGAAADDAGYKMLFSLLNGLNGNMTSCGIAPQVSYFFADNTSVGIRFDYDKSVLGLGNANFALGDMMSFGVQDVHYLKQSYSGSLTLRHYMSIADSRRFAIFVEGRGTLGYAQSKSYQFQGEDKYGTYQDIYKASLSLVPGVVCFMMDNAAFEVSIGVLGFDTQKVEQTTNQVEYSEMKSGGANFKINLLSVNFGMSFYIYPKKERR